MSRGRAKSLIRRASAATLGAWYRLPIAVAIMIAVPLVVVGESSAADARDRAMRSEVAATAQLADRAATLLSTRLSDLHQEVIGAARSDEIRTAAGFALLPGVPQGPEADTQRIEEILATQKSVMSGSIDRLTYVTNQWAVLGQVPRDSALASSRPSADYAAAISGGNTDRIRVVAHAGADATLAFVGNIPSAGRKIVADVPLKVISDALRSAVGSGEALQISDPAGTPLQRVGDLPIGDRSFSSGATVSATGWRVVALRSSAPIDDLDGVLAGQRAIRLGLGALLLLGAVALGRVGAALGRERNALAASLERQTATSEILEIIAGSPSDVRPVLEALASHAADLCDAPAAFVYEIEGSERLVAFHGDETFRQLQRTHEGSIRSGRERIQRRILAEKRIVHVPDTSADPEFADEDAHGAVGFHAFLGAPMMRGDAVIGTIQLCRIDPVAFSGEQVALLETFAAQASIAIENVRLFNETKEALGQQAATSEILRVIATSPGDLQPMVKAIALNARVLCNADDALVLLRAGDELRHVARSGNLPRTDVPASWLAWPITPDTVGGASVLEHRTIHVPDMQASDLYPRSRDMAQHIGFRAFFVTPIVRGADVIGVLGLRRIEAGSFSEREIVAAESFAAQAAIALSNVRLFDEIQEKSQQLEAASRHKSEFLANMSHELRTPLNAVIGFSDVLEQGMVGPLNTKQTEYVRDISSSGKHLLDLVNEILDLSKVEAGRMELEPSEFAVSEAVLSTFNFVRERAAKHGIELAADVPSDLGTITADERKVRQVLLNLLSNAVKFTPDRGWIGVTARRADGQVTVSVRDTGIGIAPEDQPKVFDEFRQVGKATDRSREGTGLGLTLAKRFIELHGGRIWLDSEVGNGTTFTFALPTEVGAAAAVER